MFVAESAFVVSVAEDVTEVTTEVKDEVGTEVAPLTA